MHVEQNVSLARYTTLHIGGPARYVSRIASETELLEAIHFAREQKLPTFTLGGGSNLVIPDEGYAGLVLQIALPHSILLTSDGNFIRAEVSAGTDWDALVLSLCEQQLSGMECLAGIPGLVGGSPIQNIGAYGQEVSQTIASVRALDLHTLTFVELSKQFCGFAYRSSIFNSTQRNRYIVTCVTFRLDPRAKPNLTYADLRRIFGPDAQPTPLEVYAAVRRIRAEKGMVIDPACPSPDTRSAGSFFKNPVVPAAILAEISKSLAISEDEIPHWASDPGRIKLSAAWLIERAGFPKGFRSSPDSTVAISGRHTLALTNYSGTATCRDLQELADLIVRTTLARFHVSLVQEPVTLS